MRAWVRWADGGTSADVDAALRHALEIDPANRQAGRVSDAVRSAGPIRARTGEPYIAAHSFLTFGEWTVSAGSRAKLQIVAHGEAQPTDNFGAATISRESSQPARVHVDAQCVCHDCRRVFSTRLTLMLGRGMERHIVRCACASQMTLVVDRISAGRHFLLLSPFTSSGRVQAVAPEISLHMVTASTATD
jgi:hypothetical protein